MHGNVNVKSIMILSFRCEACLRCWYHQGS